ncbi:hypothetical protein MRB53_001411 [Persea americana]|uniref:Uncharacterized protein n=1 Tax=Persea americana TaxID=3435 RepID=A0ACC2MSM1_PERAE|nr:hypothetical protein MRB53_001411 [Persea americana]|eukprot:TRINITY_DN33073_c1_g1_i2.p1 TRINITY_DN33073_c1_g1~~TRINITY_DN33073_c1_g1_i2.p1  ORF type:complete len:472 (+),score=82.44 TRINITY_DN33073_c1_g1_i2:153-1568(+)
MFNRDVCSSKFSRHLQPLLQRSTTISHLHQIQSLLLKTALHQDPSTTAQFISSLSSISIDCARAAFDHLWPSPPPVFAWNSIIRAYAKGPRPSEAIATFVELQRTGIRPDNFTYPFVLKACASSCLVGEGRMMHCLVLKMGFSSDSFVRNALLHMYASCREIGFARRVFDEMGERDVVSWSSMIGGCVSCKRPVEALVVFQHMKVANVKPNSVTLVSLLSACTLLGSLSMGKAIHSYIAVNRVDLDVALGTALVVMYAKCGDIEKAFNVFTSMNVKNLQSWTVMISAFADHGRPKDAISLFIQMESRGLKPDSVSFTALLCACSHLGMVDQGRWYFNRMENVYSIKPTMEHYGCMVDMFGRAGLVEEAYEFLRKMPMQPNSVILRSFIGAYRNHGGAIHLDEDFMKLLIEIEPDIGANYVLAANVSAVSARWNDVAQLRSTMSEKGLKKVPGCSWVEVNWRNMGAISHQMV